MDPVGRQCAATLDSDIAGGAVAAERAAGIDGHVVDDRAIDAKRAAFATASHQGRHRQCAEVCHRRGYAGAVGRPLAWAEAWWAT
jgi:hypothetical protein